MQPYPDGLLDTVGSEGERPDARVVSRETIELAFLATIQLLPPKQRAVLILRDILEFSAAETAEALGDTTASVNSALQRARATLSHRRLPATTPHVRCGGTTFDEAVLLQAYMDAQERGDVHAMVQFLREDVRMTLLPEAVTWDGRESVCCEFSKTVGAFGAGVRSIPIAANRQPAMGVYLQRPGETAYRAWAIVVLGVLDGKLREISSFASPELFARFQLPQTLEVPSPSTPLT
jgi:RNA polymerase sigma-70 factor (ECF subfamily)